MSRNKPIIRLVHFFSTLMLLIFISPTVLAQVTPDAGSLKKEAEKELPQVPDAVPRSETPTPPVAKPGEPRVPVNQFIFSGNTLLSEAQLQAVVAPWRNQSLSLDELRFVTGKITEEYRAAGYLVRVVLPEQNIRAGVIQVAIIEAKFGAVHVKQTKSEQRLRTATVMETFNARHERGDFLKITDIERATLLLGDTPGIKVKPVLMPSATLGHTDIGVEVSDEPLLSGLVSLDNYGARSTGRARLTPVVKIANPSGIGDEVQLIGLLSEGNLYGRARYSRPIGHDGLRIGGNASYLRYDLGSDFKVLEAEGSAATVGLDAAYPLIRSQHNNLRLVANATHQEYDNEQFGESISDKSVDALNIGLSGDVLDRFHGGGISFYGVELTGGELDLSDHRINQTQDELGPQTEGGYGKLTWNIGRLQRLLTTTNLWLSLNGQVSSKNLDSSETFSLGGMGGVRAYPILEASGDDGWLFTAELRHNLRSNLILTPFLDYGQVKERSTQLQGSDTHDLAGVGVGVDWTFADDLALRASIARRLGTNPLRDPVTGDDSDGSYNRWPVWVSVAKYF